MAKKQAPAVLPDDTPAVDFAAQVEQVVAPKKARKAKVKEKDVLTAFRLNPAARKQLDHLRVDQGESLQSMLIEAVNDLFEKYKKKPIA